MRSALAEVAVGQRIAVAGIVEECELIAAVAAAGIEVGCGTIAAETEEAGVLRQQALMKE